MNLENIKLINDNLYVYQTKEFATVKLEYAFSFENTKENYMKAILLSLYLKRTNSKSLINIK